MKTLDLRDALYVLGRMKERNYADEEYKIGIVIKDIPTDISRIQGFVDSIIGGVVLFRLEIKSETQKPSDKYTIEFPYTREEITSSEMHQTMLTHGTIVCVPENYITEILFN